MVTNSHALPGTEDASKKQYVYEYMAAMGAADQQDRQA
jgi:hypothetical protein